MDDNTDSAPLYRIDNPGKEKQQELNLLSGIYLLLGAFAAFFLLFPASAWKRVALDSIALALFITMVGIEPIVQPITRRFPRNMRLLLLDLPKKIGLLERIDGLPKTVKNYASGLSAELRVAQSIVMRFGKQKVKVFSRLDETCLVVPDEKSIPKQKDVDVVAVFPTGLRLAISVKRRERARVVIIDKNNEIRLIGGGRTKRERRDSAAELIEQERWLRQHRKQLLATNGDSVSLPFVRALVFASPTTIGTSEQHEYITLGGKPYLKVTRGKDFVYLLQEDQLCDFIDALLKRR